MKNLVIALVVVCSSLFAVNALADVGVVKPHHKKKAKVVQVTHKPTTPPVVVAQPGETAVVNVTPPVVPVVKAPESVKAPEKKCEKVGCGPAPKVIVGGHIALGGGVLPGYYSMNYGLRLEIPKAYLGFEVFLSAPYGVGAQAMVYAYRGETVKLHVFDLGFLVNFQSCGGPGNACQFNLSDQQFARRVDLLTGLGVQVKINCNIDFTADWRVDIADPVGLYNHRNLAASNPYLDMGHVFRNAFGSSQLLVGLNFHN